MGAEILLRYLRQVRHLRFVSLVSAENDPQDFY